MAFITMHLAGYLADPASPPPGPAAMQLNGAYCCYFVYRTRDGKHVTLGALEPKFWDNFCRAIHRPDLAGQGFSPARAGTPVFDAVVAEFASRTQAEWAELNATFDFCCEPVLDFSAVRTHPQFAEMFFELPVGATSSPQIEVPLGLQGVTGRGASTPPNLGEHTASVLAEVGVDESVYADLKARGVV
jgi:crotonobetainyl-CoA:carnitine CoA-transferase CaiB-like acyl-CoA transferase